MYMYVYVCVYVYVYIYARMCMHTCICMYVCIIYRGELSGGNVLPKMGEGNCPGGIVLHPICDFNL